MSITFSSGVRLGEFEIRRPLGRGGMGTVYKAVRLETGEPVVVKVLSAELAQNEAHVKRFLREARLCQSLAHPGIVRTYAVDEKAGRYYMVLEFLDGETIAERLIRTGPFQQKETLRVTAMIADALSCAHAAGIVHRDIKPENIILTADGGVKVIDFGLAKFLESESGITGDGTRLGTPAYMSPEQCQSADVGVASDIYSLGITMFEMLVGRTPYEKERAIVTMYQIVKGPAIDLGDFLPSASDDLVSLVNKMIEKNPSKRPTSSGYVRDECERVLNGKLFARDPVTPKANSNIALRRTGFALPARIFQTRMRALLAGFLLIVSIALGTLAILAWFPRNFQLEYSRDWGNFAYTWQLDDGSTLRDFPQEELLVGDFITMRWLRRSDDANFGSIYWLDINGRIEVLDDLSEVTPLDSIRFPLEAGDVWSAEVLRPDPINPESRSAQAQYYRVSEDEIAIGLGVFRAMRVLSGPAQDSAIGEDGVVARWFVSEFGLVKIDATDTGDIFRTMEVVHAERM